MEHMESKLKLLAVDSDGCALDAMEVKHRSCFTPAIISTWGLEAIGEAVTDTALRINLYSKQRGVNRFVALNLLFTLLRCSSNSSVREQLPSMTALHEWVTSGAIQSEAGLKEAMATASIAAGKDLEQVLRWTTEVNRLVALLPPPPAFACVPSTLALARQRGLRICVVSSATRAAIQHEWTAAGIAHEVAEFFGQEDGTKAAVLGGLIESVGDAGAVLMVGDAPGDHAAANAVSCAFFPILPGAEDTSWKTLRDQVIARLPAYPDADLLAAEEQRFLAALPELE